MQTFPQPVKTYSWLVDTLLAWQYYKSSGGWWGAMACHYYIHSFVMCSWLHALFAAFLLGHGVMVARNFGSSQVVGNSQSCEIPRVHIQ